MNSEEYIKHQGWEAKIRALGPIEVKHQPNELCDCHPEITPFHCHAAANSGGFPKQVKKARVILFKPSGKYYCEEEWRIPEGEVIPVPDSSRKRKVLGPYDMEFSPDFRRISGGSVLIESQEPWGYPHLFPGMWHYPHLFPDGSSFAPVINAEENVLCFCGHPEAEHYAGCCMFDTCMCGEWRPTTAEQSPSYSKSVQSEQQPQYEERQASSRYQCKDQHVRTVVDLLVHMVSTSELNPPGGQRKDLEQLYQLWLALYLCEATECQVFHKLVEQAQSNLPRQLRSYLRTRKEPPNSGAQ